LVEQVTVNHLVPSSSLGWAAKKSLRDLSEAFFVFLDAVRILCVIKLAITPSSKTPEQQSLGYQCEHE
jgi:hypothetical protein